MARAHADDTPPGDLNLDNGAPITTANSLVVASNRPIYAIWSWIPTTNSGTYTFELWEVTGDDDPGPAGGTLLASEVRAAAAVIAGQWNRIELADPIDVTTGKVYRVARHATSGRFVRTVGAFTSGPIANGGITLLQSGTDVGGLFAGVIRNGVFREGAAGNYPASVFGQPDYYLDVDDEGTAPDPIDLSGAITVGEPAVSGSARLQLAVTGALVVGSPTVAATVLHLAPISLTGAITVGEPVIAGAVDHPSPDIGTPASSTSTVTARASSTPTVTARAVSTSTVREG